MRYHIITYGCQMNKSDSERVASLLENKGYKSALKIEDADLIVVNMCSVRQSAVNKIYGLWPKFQKLKGKNLKLKTVLTGCILKRDRKKLRERFDEIWNVRNYFDIQPKGQKDSRAFIPISNGCNNFCAYCVVPLARGRLVCRNHRDILKEVKNAVKKGKNEIWLLGQNVNDYQSPVDASLNFAKLLKMANDLPGNFRIRFMSPNPKNFSDELIEAMATCEKVAKFLNLPVQSGDDKILKKMNRPYTIKQYKNLVKKIRRKIPNINLTTDVIVGFPGESKARFENTAKLFKEIKFNMAYIAKYSPRKGTAAFLMKDDVLQREKKKRAKILREILNSQSIDLRSR